MNTAPSSTPMRERGGCLSLYLILAFLGSVFGLVALLLASGSLAAANAALVAQGAAPVVLPGWYIPGEIVVIVVTLAAIYGIYTWKKWGVYLLVGTWVLNILFGVGSGTGLGSSLGVLVIEAVLLWYVLRNKWQLFEG